jgi:hypothetical protein
MDYISIHQNSNNLRASQIIMHNEVNSSKLIKDVYVIFLNLFCFHKRFRLLQITLLHSKLFVGQNNLLSH